MQMTWSDLLFAHWPVNPDVLAPLLPEGLALDTARWPILDRRSAFPDVACCPQMLSFDSWTKPLS